MLTIKPPKFL